MEPKIYGLGTLARICTGGAGSSDDEGCIADIEQACRFRPHDLEPRYRVRDGGLWHNISPATRPATKPAAGETVAERDVLRWKPEPRDGTKPALPIPFTAGQFAAFTLAGLGALLIERFEDDEDEDALSERELSGLGRNGADAKEVLREANRLRMEAITRFRRNVARPNEPELFQLDEAGTNAAVKWLLSQKTSGTQNVAQSNAGGTVYLAKRRRSPLDAVIDMARERAANPGDWMSVWASLVVLAQPETRPPPLLGFTEGEGVKYQTDAADEPVAWLTREALRAREGRRKSAR